MTKDIFHFIHTLSDTFHGHIPIECCSSCEQLTTSDIDKNVTTPQVSTQQMEPPPPSMEKIKTTEIEKEKSIMNSIQKLATKIGESIQNSLFMGNNTNNSNNTSSHNDKLPEMSLNYNFDGFDGRFYDSDKSDHDSDVSSEFDCNENEIEQIFETTMNNEFENTTTLYFSENSNQQSNNNHSSSTVGGSSSATLTVTSSIETEIKMKVISNQNIIIGYSLKKEDILIAYKKALESKFIYLSLIKNKNENNLLRIDDIIESFNTYHLVCQKHDNQHDKGDSKMDKESIVNAFKVCNNITTISFIKINYFSYFFVVYISRMRPKAQCRYM